MKSSSVTIERNPEAPGEFVLTVTATIDAADVDDAIAAFAAAWDDMKPKTLWTDADERAAEKDAA